MTAFLISERTDSGPQRPDLHILLAHGAGAPMDSPFMNMFANDASAHNLTVARFEFAYMAQRRTGGQKRPPSPVAQLCDEYRTTLRAYREQCGDDAAILIGGKSMGGRVASMIADEAFAAGQIAGVVCLGYPFHPQSKPEVLRTDHLRETVCPMLILQGERDPLGSRDEVAGYDLSSTISVHWIGDGDHDFGPRGRSGFTKTGNIKAAASATAEFAQRVGQ
ncbi:MAG: alpha/beta family hydrolase [Pseudomonadota bacterium]